jgi:DNA-binding NarL/FixJ family response regulator
VHESVFIVDEQAPFRAGLHAVLERAGYDVVGEAVHAAEAIDTIADLHPELCVLGGDGATGASATERVLARVADVHVIVLVSAMTHGGLLAALRAGAYGYLPRTTSCEALVRVAEAVLAGEYAIPRLALIDLINELRKDGHKRLALGDVAVTLTKREAEILDMLEDGMSTKEIALVLDVSPITVRRHIGAIAEKAGRHGRENLLRLLHAA